MKRPRPPLYKRSKWELGEYVMENTRREGDCLIYTGTINADGYGHIASFKFMGQAHRLAYERFVGPIPEGLQLDHLCRNRACVNVEHLEPVTSRENTLRGASVPGRNGRKSACVHGHEFTPENTYLSKDGRRRGCRTCALARHRRRRDERNAALTKKVGAA